MSKGRMIVSSLACFGLLACFAGPAPQALTPEEENFGENPEPIPVWPLPTAELAHIARNYWEFFNTFTIKVYWNPANYTSPAQWPWPFYDPDPEADNGTMEEFIRAVMPPARPQDDMYDESAMRRTFYYFGHDWEHDNDSEPWVPYYPTYVLWNLGQEYGYITHFNIEIWPPGGGSDQVGETLYLSLPNGETTTARMAFDGFAHEWKHLIEATIGWQPGYSVGADRTHNELFAQCAEYLSGWLWLNESDPATRVELPFSRGLFTGDYYQACVPDPEHPDQPGHGQGDKHMTYSMFKPYLMDHYSLGQGYANNALFRWIHSKLHPLEQDELPARGDLKGLSILLGGAAYAPFFSASAPDGDGDARVREMFQEFALSLWVNKPGLLDEDFPRSEASVWANGASPSGTHGYMVDFDYDCKNDVHTLPLYNIVTATHQNKDDLITLRDLYPDSPSCYGQPPYPRRPLQVSTYGYNVLPFVADPAIQDEALAYDLRVDVSVDDSYWCELAHDDVDAELTDNEVLHFYVLGYPEATSALHEAGDEAELINTYEFSSFDSNPTPTFSFSVGRFGVRYKSVVLLMTLTEKALENGPRTAKVLPFDYSYWAEGNTAPITADTYWPSPGLIHDGIVSLNGEVTIQSGKKLTIMPGAQVFCADKAAVPGGVVGFDVLGVLQIGSPAGATVQVEGVQGAWNGISLTGWAGSGLSVHSAEVRGFSEISAGANAAVDLSASTFELGEGAAGYAFAGAASAEVADCQFIGAGVFTLGGSVGAHTLEDSQFLPLTLEASGSALSFEGNVAVENVTVLGAGPISVESGHATVTALNATTAGVEGHELGLQVGAGASLVLHDSELIGLSELSAEAGAAVAISGTTFALDANGVGYALAAAETVTIQDCQFTGTGILSLGNAAGVHSIGTSTFSPLPGGARCTELLVEDDASVVGVLLEGAGIRCTGGMIELTSVEATAPGLAIPLVLTGVAISGDAEVLANDCAITGFDYAIALADASTLTLHESYLADMHIGVLLNTTQAVDLGHDGGTPDSPYWGNNCFEMAAGSTCRTSKLSRGGCTAQRNYWGAETPLPSFFCGGGVNYAFHHTACPFDPPDGGQFSFGVVPGSGAADDGLKLTIYPNPGNPSFVICALLPATEEGFTLAVYDVAGRVVKELAGGTADGREHQTTWDGNDQLGHPSGSGVYFVRVHVGASTAATQKLVLVR